MGCWPPRLLAIHLGFLNNGCRGLVHHPRAARDSHLTTVQAFRIFASRKVALPDALHVHSTKTSSEHGFLSACSLRPFVFPLEERFKSHGPALRSTFHLHQLHAPERDHSLLSPHTTYPAPQSLPIGVFHDACGLTPKHSRRTSTCLLGSWCSVSARATDHDSRVSHHPSFWSIVCPFQCSGFFHIYRPMDRNILSGLS
ncbi:hypothetical protein B0T21DRAFT_124242 [Apiosordaria backusii]|uniref:Uncharacterized protein n=1 Tax=Apiosordaria backusii TaxID=314023 RepID=A0AA40EMN6_9PEZI|nr:hypothetical protein B0T21DRAFT_124242 [Apiosordaria backusii]